MEADATQRRPPDVSGLTFRGPSRQGGTVIMTVSPFAAPSSRAPAPRFADELDCIAYVSARSGVFHRVGRVLRTAGESSPE